MKTSYLFLANGFEEVEALATVDTLRRANIPVATVSISDTNTVTGAHGIPVISDLLINEIEIDEAPWLILPGGLPGATNLADCKVLVEMLHKQIAAGRNIAAICASPAVVLYPNGLLDGLKATCYPGFEDSCPGCQITGNPVEVTPRIITGKGPGFTFRFALAIVAATAGQEAADQVASGLLLKN